jgi:hypothetical protein
VSLPESLTLNAFTGEGRAVSSELAQHANRWGSRGQPLTRQAPLAPDELADERDWSHPDVGWGVILPDRKDLKPEAKSRALDAPEPIQKLVAARGGGPVFRYRPDLGIGKLARYFADGTMQDPEIGLTTFGTYKGRLPRYLLIVGSPREIPWRLQYSLNRRHHVGRLDLPPEGLANYVSALLTDWKDLEPEPARPVLWSVSFDSMTNKMDVTLARQIKHGLEDDDELSLTAIEGDAATRQALVDALSKNRPALIVTSSHGKTGPLEDPEAMRRDLGVPVDADRTALDIDALLQAWAPSGAVWYAFACCSAGSNDGTNYEGLLDDGSYAAAVVTAVGRLGAAVAPLPTRLLGAPKPLRAFVGHVEPTFDWTLVMSDTGQFLTAPLVTAVYPNLYLRQPIGLALDDHYRGVGDLYAKLADARRDIDGLVEGARDRATYYRLTSTDRESLVTLGDPTVVIPPLPSQN